MLMDTAGRLQNRAELMSELEKIIRVMKKVDPEAPHATLLVLDATVGQNALNQVEIFGRIAGVTGLVMTKLDGTARGGILVAIADKFALPVISLASAKASTISSPSPRATSPRDRRDRKGRIRRRNDERPTETSSAASKALNPMRQVRARARAAGAVLHRLFAGRHLRRDGHLDGERPGHACRLLLDAQALSDHAADDSGDRPHLRFADARPSRRDADQDQADGALFPVRGGFVRGLALKKPILKILFDGALHVTEEGWRKLTWRWAFFFLALAVLNEIVWRTQTTDLWVKFKTFGFLPLTLLFALAQAPLMMKYETKDEGPGDEL